MTNICVFTGSSIGKKAVYEENARRFGRELARREIGLVYGGASVGLMGAVADGALDEGGRVTGVIPRALAAHEIAHQHLTELIVVETMHERKAKMAELADGFVALPGGIGTLEEIFEIWTWAQLGIHAKPLGFLDVDRFYQPLETFLDQLVREQFVRDVHREMVLVDHDPLNLIERLLAASMPSVQKWIKPEET